MKKVFIGIQPAACDSDLRAVLAGAARLQVQGLDLRSSHLMVGRLGFPMPRRLQTKLVIELPGGDEQELFGPGSARRKRSITAALGMHEPGRLAADLERIKRDW